MKRLRFQVGAYSLYATLLLTLVAVRAQDKSDAKAIVDIETIFVASGWMGDGEYGREYIELNGACKKSPHSEPTCIEVKYTFGPKRWAGIYWQNKPDNWGDKPGDDYSKKGITKLTFWARGRSGNEIIEFKAGDIGHPKKEFKDSFGATSGRISLSREWSQYTIDLENADLSSVIGGFCWVASKDYNEADAIVFYIDDMHFE